MSLKTFVSSAASAVKSFVAEAPGAVKGHLNPAEIQRIAVSAFLSSGSLYAVALALVTHLPAIVAPGDVALVTAAVSLVSEFYRRLNHGTPA
jgi:hypothetical protein